MIADEGMGKRTIAAALATELGVPCQEVNAQRLEARGELTAVLTSLRENEILIVGDVHRLRRVVQDALLQTLGTHKLTVSIGQGQSARQHVLQLRPFTLVGTAPKKSECSGELLNHFSLVVSLHPYSTEALEAIAERIASLANLDVDLDARRLLAANCGRNPHQLQLLLERVARAINKRSITAMDTVEAFAAFDMRVCASTQTDDLASLDLMSGVEFERLVTTLLARMEFRAEMTRATGDGGIDIVAALDKPILGGKYLFQCKRYAADNLVGAPTVRDFYGAVMADKAVKGILITTSDFTSQAREFAERVGLELINRSQLQQLLAEHSV